MLFIMVDNEQMNTSYVVDEANIWDAWTLVT